MATIFGYGVNLSKLKFTNEEAMKNFIKTYLPDRAQDMEEDLSSNNYSVFEWIGYYDSMGYTGMSALLANVINEQEHLEHITAYDSIPNCVYLSVNYPWCFNKHERELTPASLESIFRKYISQLTSDPIVCEDLSLYVESLD